MKHVVSEIKSNGNQKTSNRIKTAVIGYGLSAQTFHLPFLQSSDQYDLVAVSLNPNKLLKNELSEINTFTNAEELIDQTDANLIIITAPNQFHFDLAKKCLLAGKHIIIEKPVTTTKKDAEVIKEISCKTDQIVAVFHNRRWDGDFLTIKKLIQSRELGDIRFFESHFDRFRPDVRDKWKEQPCPGSGVLYDLGAHLIDQVLSLFGIPEAVTANCLNLRDGSETIDYFHGILHYRNCEAIIHSSPFCASPNLRFQIQGTQGSYIKYGLDPQAEQLSLGLSPDIENWGTESINAFGKIYSEKETRVIPTEKGRYQTFFQEMANAINNKTEPPVTIDQAISVMKIIENIEESSHLKKTIFID